MQQEYGRIQTRFHGGINRLAMDDPDAAWARPKKILTG
jgi:hypothetical protein